jgi:hypothetical protein
VVSGVNLTGSIQITASAGIQISTDDATWQSALPFAPSAYTPNEVIYVRISPTAPKGTLTGTITCTNGALVQRLSVTGVVK